MTVDIRVSRLHRLYNEETNVKAFADIEVSNAILVKGLQVMNGKKGLFVSMPRQKGKDNKWYETVRTLSPEIKDHIASIVLSAYQEENVA